MCEASRAEKGDHVTETDVTDVTDAPWTPAGVRSWLVEHLALHLKVPAAEVDPDASLTGGGLDSVHAHTLCADIEDALGVYIEPPQLWEADTVNRLAAYLVERTS